MGPVSISAPRFAERDFLPGGMPRELLPRQGIILAWAQQAPGLPIGFDGLRCRYSMKTSPTSIRLVVVLLGATVLLSAAAVRQESFDREPANWEGVNSRNKFFEPKTVAQDFGYSSTSRAGGQAGEIGGRINPAGEPAYYGYRLPTPLNLDSP